MTRSSSNSKRAGKRAGLKINVHTFGTLSGVCPMIVGTGSAHLGTQVSGSAHLGTLTQLGDQWDGVPDALTRSKGPARPRTIAVLAFETGSLRAIGT